MSSDPLAERTRALLGRRRSLGVITAGVLLVSLGWAGPLPQASRGGQKVEESEIKAVYLYNFLQFVQWPDSRRGAAPAAVQVIGIVGDTPLSLSLAALQTSLGAGGKRQVRVVHFGPWHEKLDLGSCDLLFLGPSEQGNFGRILAALDGRPVLTVADADAEYFLESGGMISLTEDQGRLRWMINRRSADRVGLRFNAQMLRLAIKVVE